MEYARFDGLGLADLVRRGEVRPQEILEAAFTWIEALNPRLNAIILSLRDRSEAEVEAGLARGPFTGVPIALKDEYLSCAGVPAGSGSRLWQGYTRPYDSELVKRYRRAGLVIVAKTNLPEFGTSITTEPVLHGACRNPWDLQRTPGGSSGGSACAVASGMVPLAYANDGGGSIRVPAACCGLFGLKPTRGRLPTGPDAGDYWNGLIVQHAITRSVRDSAALLDATEGPDLGASYRAPPKLRSYFDEVGADPGRLRIAFSTTSPLHTPVAPDCVAALEDTARLCSALGHDVEEAYPSYNAAALADALGTLVSAHLANDVEVMARALGRSPDPELIERSNLALVVSGRRVSAVELLGALNTVTEVSRGVAPFFERYDVLLTPTIATPPPLIGYITADDPDPERYTGRSRAFRPWASLANVTGNPAMSVPLQWDSGNLPLGAHFIGRFGDEATLFRLASQLETARPWHARHPPVSAWGSGG